NMKRKINEDETTTPKDRQKDPLFSRLDKMFGRLRPALERDTRAQWDVQKLEKEVQRLGEIPERDLGYTPRKVKRPNMKAVEQLGRDIKKLRYNRRMRRNEAKILIKAILLLRRRQGRLETLVFEQGQRLRQQQHRRVMVWPVSSKSGSHVVGDY